AEDEEPGEAPPDPRRGPQGTRRISREAPDRGVQDAAAVQRERRDQVKDRQHSVDGPEITENRSQPVRVGRDGIEQQEDPGQYQTGKRPGENNPELLSGRAEFV